MTRLPPPETHQLEQLNAYERERFIGFCTVLGLAFVIGGVVFAVWGWWL